MKLGFTGTQTGMTEHQKKSFIELLSLFCDSNTIKMLEFCHGDCIGSDTQANELAFDAGCRIFSIYPPNDSKKRAWCFNSERDLSDNRFEWNTISYKDTQVQVRWMPRKAYLERNKDIVNDSERMIATPKEFTHSLRSGTWATIRYAWKVKKDITILHPVESVEEMFYVNLDKTNSD